MAAAKETRGRVWENQELLLLIQKWGNDSVQMKILSCTRKSPIWKEYAILFERQATKSEIKTLAKQEFTL